MSNSTNITRSGCHVAKMLPVVIALMAALLTGLAFQGSRGLYETTEGRYALAAREMADSGDWLTPSLEGEIHITKPPLTYWSIMLGIRILGRNAWGARIFNVLAFAAAAALMASLAQTLTCRRDAGLIAGLIYATGFFPVGIAASLNTDTLLALWSLLGVFCYVKAWRAGPRHPEVSRRYITLMWLAFGAGMLTKGPPALLPLAALLVHHFSVHRRRCPFVSIMGVAGFVLIGLGWYLLMILRDPELLRYFLVTETADRMTSGRGHHNSEWYRPFTVYAPVLLAGAGIWPILVSRQAGRRMAQLSLWRRAWRRRGGAWLLTLWFALPLLIFCISRSRLPTYVLPVFPPLVIMLSLAIAGQHASERTPERSKRIRLVALLSIALIFTMKALMAYLPLLDVPDVRIIENARNRMFERDMGRLYDLCRPWDRDDRHAFLLVEHHRSLGLLFYLNSPSKRVQLTPKTLAGAIHYTETNDKARIPILIIEAHRTNELPRIAALFGVGVETLAGNPYWSLLTVTNQAP